MSTPLRYPLRPFNSLNMNYTDPRFRQTISETPTQMRKIFIGGLPFNCTREVMYEYFIHFGAIQDCVVMTDAVTKVSRGFGFVTFNSEEAVHAVILSKPHVLMNKTVDVKRAVAKHQLQPQFPPPSFDFTPETGTKVLIRSMTDTNNHPVKWTCSIIQMLHEYFSQFGELEQIEQNTGGTFVIFSRKKAAEDVLTFNGGSHTYNLINFQLERDAPKKNTNQDSRI